MFNKLRTTALAVLLSSSFALADGGDYFDIKMGVGTWSMDVPTGEFGQVKSDPLGVNFDAFGLQETDADYMWAEFQHAIPLIPHIRAEYAQMTFSGQSTTTFTFGPYSYDANVKSDLVLDNLDAIAFWDVGLFGDTLDLNYGVGAKVIMGTMTGEVAGNTQTTDIVAPAVYAYVDARFTLPFGFGLELEHKWYPGGLELEDVEFEFSETIAKIDYTLELAGFLKLGVEAGQRSMDLELYMPVEQIYVNMGLSGTFVGAFVKLEI